MKNCWNCENQIPKNAKVCKFCGSVQLGVEQEKAKPDKENNASCDKKQAKCIKIGQIFCFFEKLLHIKMYCGKMTLNKGILPLFLLLLKRRNL